jgi:hypothetical protein
MRAWVRSPAGEAAYARRKAVVEPIFGVLKQQREMRQLCARRLQNVNNEFTLATQAFNITLLHALSRRHFSRKPICRLLVGGRED